MTAESMPTRQRLLTLRGSSNTAASSSWMGRLPGEREPRLVGEGPRSPKTQMAANKNPREDFRPPPVELPKPRGVFPRWVPSSQRAGAPSTPCAGPNNKHKKSHINPHLPSQLIRTLLIRGGIEPNPGPTPSVKCHHCGKTIARRRPPPAAYPPIACPGCDKGFHLKCTDLRETKDLHPGWRCQGCLNHLPQMAPTPPAPAPSLPHRDRRQQPAASPAAPQPDPPHQNPVRAPTPPSSDTPVSSSVPASNPPGADNYAFVQWNVGGIQSSRVELENFLGHHKVKVAALQETKLHASSNTPTFANYTLIRKDRSRNAGGGLAFLVHHSVTFTHLPTDFNSDPVLEIQGITATIRGAPLNIFNIYIPPPSSCPGHQLSEDTLEPFFNTDADTLILGDFNAHNGAWFSATQCDRAAVRGETIADAINSSDLYLLNQPTPTHPLPTPTSPDLSMISAHLATAVEWRTHNALNSDHLPITISFVEDSPPIRTKRTYINFHRADWTSFTALTEQQFDSLPPPTSAAQAVNKFNRILLDAAKTSIPAGYRKDFNPSLTPEILTLTTERDSRRAQDPTDPAIPALNAEIDHLIRDTARSRWRATVSSTSYSANTRKFWTLIRSLSGTRTRIPPNQPISFTTLDGTTKTCTKPSAIAKFFTKQFTSIKPHTQDPELRKTLRRLHQEHQLDHSFSPFTSANTTEAIKQSKNSTATGPDNLSILHLKNLGPSGTQYLTDICNLSISQAEIPDIWKKAIIIPLLKAGKPAELGKSYRPISLLCPASKVLERLILPHLTATLTPNNTQHGFRSMRSTTTALLPLSTMVAVGFNQQKPASRTAALAIDFAKAFDSVDHPTLLRKLLDAPLHPNYTRWLFCYLRGRKAACQYLTATAPFKIIHTGVPQGSVVSPCIFNFFLSDSPASPHMVSSYADDLTLAVSHPDITRDVAPISNILSSAFLPIQDWARENKLTVAPEKSSVTLFTPWTGQFNCHPSVTINNSPVPLDRNPKILGVIFDPLFTFSPHISSVSARATSRLQIMKAIAGTSWGQDKETLLLTYNSIIKPILTYASPIWYPAISKTFTNINKLQVIQNTALRITTGCVLKTDTQHLHSECKVLPVRDHLRMLSAQFYASALRPNHPSNQLVTAHPGPRTSRIGLLQTTVAADVVGLTEADGSVDPEGYRAVVGSIHTNAVSNHLTHRRENRVLQQPAPDISASEVDLPRHHRTTLAQLRSGQCSRLLTYRYAIGISPTDACPECGTEPHTTQHLFRCTAAPTALSLDDLWENPIQVAQHLTSLSAFDSLPPLELQGPRPPPEPPPGT